jgi:hypothetical protein
MFNNKHYIPILRWKAAEREALGHVSLTDKVMMTPLIELIMPQPKEASIRDGDTPGDLLKESVALFKEKLTVIPTEILECWGRDPVFIDMHLIDGSIRAESMANILSAGKSMDIFMIPVVNVIPVVDFESDMKTRQVAVAFAKEHKYGLCLRLSRSDLRQESIASNIEGFLQKSNLKKKDVDLLVDLQIVDDQYQPLLTLINSLPDLKQWRTFTLVSGAFPPDLTQFTVPDLYKIPRDDWNNWKKAIAALTRKPSFGDYTIQHPLYREPVPGANPSASIRYTDKEGWLVMRGQGLRSPKSAGFAQYPANAKLLADTPEYKSFGEKFSYGDAYIAKMGKDVNSKETGNPRTWLRAGINHHLACVAFQLANLRE